jgi:exopolysaccharide production protein ExoQ
MSPPSRRQALMTAAWDLGASARFTQALTLGIVGMAYSAFATRSTIGWPGLLGVVGALVFLAAFCLIAKRAELEWRGLLPISLLVFLSWSTLSIAWSDYQWVSLGSVAYQLAFAFLAVFVALTRDLIQIVRAFGDILRVVLAASLVLEIMSGLLLDTPFLFLSILGNLDNGGPIQGLLGTRNQLGLVALVALVTFFTELRTKSVPRPLAVASLALAVLTILLTRSPVTFGALVVVAIAAASIIGLRSLNATRRRAWQFVLLAGSVMMLAILFVARGRVISLLNAGSEFEFRYRLWRSTLDFTPDNTLEGFGWTGYWRQGLPPFIGIDPFSGPHSSALNAFLDVWLQLGLVGLLAFIALVGLAFVRSWLLASNRRSIVFLWPALILVALLVTSAAESSALVEFGWLTLVVCVVKSSQNLSWRARLPEN